MSHADPFSAWPRVLPVWLDWLRNPAALSALGIGLALLGLVSLLGLPFLLARIPADYFTRPPTPAHRGSARWFGRVAKNLLGGILLLLGIAMLVLPGQGVLTILVAVALLDFPRKRRLELWLIRRPKVLEVLNSLRTNTGHPPLELDPPTCPPAPNSHPGRG